ncbi:MAG: hypothetical protein M0R03_20795 [Novosphingobium sp.]|nr:hypothetical protein [Novosphingobium sp.]
MNINQLISKLLNNLKLQAKFFVLVSLFASSLNINAANTDLTEDKVSKLREFIVKFLDKNVEPSKAFESWLEDLKDLLKDTPKFNDYCSAISDIKNLEILQMQAKILKNLKILFQRL